jgi:hypothetical protein
VGQPRPRLQANSQWIMAEPATHPIHLTSCGTVLQSQQIELVRQPRYSWERMADPPGLGRQPSHYRLADKVLTARTGLAVHLRRDGSEEECVDLQPLWRWDRDRVPRGTPARSWQPARRPPAHGAVTGEGDTARAARLAFCWLGGLDRHPGHHRGQRGRCPSVG